MTLEDRDYNAFLSEVRASTDIVAVVSEYVTLRKAGRRHKGLCPFHDEKTPSFSVDGDKGLFYCFGCQTGGDSFKFLMLREGMDFPESARVLGERLNLKPPERKGPGSDRRRRVYQVNTTAVKFFRKCLEDPQQGKTAREYLDQRGVTEEIRTEFEIGFAPRGWDNLRDHLGKQGFDSRTGIEAGLLVDRDGKSVYDRFRERIIFPIRTAGGEVVAFGGRTLDPKESAKYINSPESPVYIKGDVLYGLDRSRQSIRDHGFAVLVEGYLDVIGVAAGGFRNVVASLGTALTASQARLLRRTTERVVINYDADDAGRKATHRALEILLGMDFQVSVFVLEDGMDPDDFVREKGAEAYLEALRGSKPAIEFLTDEVAAEYDLEHPHARAQAVNQLLPFVARLQSVVERTSYLNLIADRLRVDEDVLRDELREALKAGRKQMRHAGRNAPGRQGQQQAGSSPPPVKLNRAEGRLVAILASNPRVRATLRREVADDDFTGSGAETLMRTLLEDESADQQPASLAGLLPDEASRTLLARVLLERDDEEEQDEDLSEREARSCLSAIRRTRLTREREAVQKQLERSHDAANLEELMATKIELSRRIDALS